MNNNVNNIDYSSAMNSQQIADTLTQMIRDGELALTIRNKEFCVVKDDENMQPYKLKQKITSVKAKKLSDAAKKAWVTRRLNIQNKCSDTQTKDFVAIETMIRQEIRSQTARKAWVTRKKNMAAKPLNKTVCKKKEIKPVVKSSVSPAKVKQNARCTDIVHTIKMRFI